MIKCLLKLAEIGYKGEQFCDVNDILTLSLIRSTWKEVYFILPQTSLPIYILKTSICVKKYVPLILRAFFVFIDSLFH